MSDRLTHHLRLIEELHQQCLLYLETDTLHDEQANRELLENLESVKRAISERGDYGFQGQDLVARIVAHYPELTPAIHRDLFWFFGGDCLHYMGEEEIARYQRLDEALQEQDVSADVVDYSALRTQIFGFS